MNLTTRCYAHRAGWLLPLLRTRLAVGPGLYGMSCSMEGGNFHICTRGHAYDVEDFALYPHRITSRNQGVFFECGEGSLTDFFFRLRGCAYVVHFDSYQKYVPYADERLAVPGGFRCGDQSEMLLWDKHSDYYRDAPPEEKHLLEDMAHGQSEEDRRHFIMKEIAASDGAP